MTVVKIALAVLVGIWFYGFPVMALARVRVRHVRAFRSRATRRR
jgi:hypothetical protein